MEAEHRDLGKILAVIGIFLLLIAVSVELVYFAIFIGAIVFFIFLYQNRKNFEHEIILLFALIAYFFAAIFLTFFIGFLREIPQIYLGVFAGIIIFTGIYFTGYLENLKH